jgi:UDP-glucose 4-epimerase
MPIDDEESVKKWMDHIQPDIIIHLAAISSPSAAVSEDQFLATNVGGTYNLVKHAPSKCRFIFASSIVVCGDSDEDHTETWRQNPQSLYALSKANAENIVTAATNLGRINGISLRFGAIVGSGLTHGVIRDYLQKAKLPDLTFKIWGQPNGPIKPYLYTDDAVAAIKLSIEKTDVTGACNIVPNDCLSINQIADTFFDVFSLEKIKEWTGENNVGDNKVLYYSNDKAYEQLGWEPLYTSKEAILKTIEDYR